MATANPTLSQKGYLWANGATVVVDTAFNSGATWLENVFYAHATNTNYNGLAIDQHDTTHIVVAANSILINVGSSNGATTLAGAISQLATRIKSIEGAGASWGVGSAPISLTAINTALGNNSIAAGSALTAATATTATALAAPTPLTSTLADYRVTPGPAGNVTVAAGSAYVDGLGNYIPAGTQVNVPLPSQPSGTNIQYCWITKPTVTGSAHSSTNGTVGVSPPVPAYPTGEEPLALVVWAGVTTRPTGVVQAADIVDIRYGHGGAGGGGGGGSGVPATPEVVIGSSGSAIQLDLILSGGDLANTTPVNGIRLDRMRVTEKIVADTFNSATLEDYLSVSVSGDIDGAITASGGQISMHVLAGKPPITVKIGGVRQLCDSTLTIVTNTVSAAGAYILVADLNGGGTAPNRFSIQLVAAVGANQVALRKMYFDGTSLYISSPHGPYNMLLPIIGGANLQPWKRNTTPFTTAALPIAGGTTLISGVGVLTFDLPDANMRVEMNWFGKCAAPASPGDMRIYAIYSTGLGVAPFQNAPYIAKMIAQPASSTLTFSGYYGDMPLIGPGPLNVTLGYTCSVINYILEDLVLKVEVSR